MDETKETILIGDRVLIDPDPEGQKTSTGLYLPPNVTKKEKVQTGYIVKTGPGYPMPDRGDSESAPWEKDRQVSSTQHLPLQAKKGDYAVFLKKPAVEVEVDEKQYLILPHSAILLLQRDKVIN